jgi:hypothetical protein
VLFQLSDELDDDEEVDREQDDPGYRRPLDQLIDFKRHEKAGRGDDRQIGRTRELPP